jgi:hypothetical protein
MNRKAWHEEPIGKRHDREALDCGEAALNEFLRRYARKNHEMGGAKTFLAIDDANNKTILGCYSLSPASIATEVGGVAMLIDARNDRVAAWYASYGALPLLDAPLSLVLPLTIVEAALKAAKKSPTV